MPTSLNGLDTAVRPLERINYRKHFGMIGTHAPHRLATVQQTPRTDPSVMPTDIVDARSEICEALQQSPIPPHELIRNPGLYMLPMELKRYLFLSDLYQQIVNVPCVIIEFGCRWGQNLAVLQSLRGIMEPFHHRRMIVGFDTFDGFPEVTPEDGNAAAAVPGAYSVSPDYQQYLQRLMALRETQSPIPEVRKFRIIKGRAEEQFAVYLEEHPETVVAMASFDMDLYQPTADCLKLLKGRLTKGSIVGFDELNHAAFPGETTAVRDVLGLDTVALRRSPWNADESYYVV